MSFKLYSVLRLYKTPPRYGVELSSKSRSIMQIAVFVHMMFGLYMFSNSTIFSVSGSIGFNLSDVTGQAPALSSSSLISIQRLSQPQVVLYIVIFVIIIGIFALTRIVNTFCPILWSKLMCLFKCCEDQI